MASLPCCRCSALCALRWVLAGLALCAASHAVALPHTAVKLLEGRVVLLPAPGGGSRCVIRLAVRNNAQVPIESLRLRIAFPTAPGAKVARGQWRERQAYFASPLAPGDQGIAVLEEPNATTFPRIEVVGVVPSLRVVLNGHVARLQPPPYIWRGVIHGPLAQIARELGMGITWHDPLQAATFSSQRHVLVLQLRSDCGVADGRLVRLPGAVRDARGVLIAPLAAPLSLLGAQVSYDADNNLFAVQWP